MRGRRERAADDEPRRRRRARDEQPAPTEPVEPVMPTPMWAGRDRDEQADDWFTLAEPAPASPLRGADAAWPAPVAPSPGDERDEAAPSEESTRRARRSAAPSADDAVPGPVTPTAPFALTWGTGASEADVPPAAPFAPPRVARRSFTPPFDDGSLPSVEPVTPTEPVLPPAPAPAPPAAGAPVDDYGAALWSALTEHDEPSALADQPPTPAAGRQAEPTPPSAADRASFPVAAAPVAPVGATPDAAAEPAADATSASANEVVPEPRQRPPFPAFAAARWGDRAEPPAAEPAAAEPPAAEPIDDLFAELGGGAPVAAAPADVAPDDAEGSATAVAAARRDPRAIDLAGPSPEVAPADSLDADADADADANADTAPGFAWNLTPDPSAADPAVASEPARGGRPNVLPVAADAAEPDVAEPEVAEPEVAEPDVAEPEIAEPDIAESDAAEPAPAESAPTMLLATPPAPPAPAAAPPTQVLPAAAAPGRQPEASAHEDVTALFGATPASATPAAAAATPAAAAETPTARDAASGRAVRRATAVAGPSGGAPGAGGPKPPTAGGGGDGKRTRRTLIWVAGALVVALVLAGLYFLGTQLGGGSSSPDAAPAPSAEATPTPTPEPTAPQPAGVHAWNTLFGGECLEPFQDAWAEEFTVVDCAAPHAAQLVFRGELPLDAAAAFPGEDALNAQMAELCRAPGVIDVGAASGVGDLQVQGTYPLEEQWATGERTYYCFANRAGGEALTGSLQGPGPTA